MGLGLLLIFVVFYVAKSGRDAVRKPILNVLKAGDGLKLRDIHYSQDDPDKGVKWILDAREVGFSGDQTSLSFQDFLLTVEPESRPPFRVKGRNGQYAREKGEIRLWGDLEGVSDNGYRFTADHVLIDEKNGHLSTDNSVKIFGPFFSVAGQGLFLDMGKETLQILSDVTTVIDRKSVF